MTEEFYLVERVPGLQMVRYVDRDGEALRVRMGAHKIGPFASISAVTEYLAAHSKLHASYEIERISVNR